MHLPIQIQLLAVMSVAAFAGCGGTTSGGSVGDDAGSRSDAPATPAPSADGSSGVPSGNDASPSADASPPSNADGAPPVAEDASPPIATDASPPIATDASLPSTDDASDGTCAGAGGMCGYITNGFCTNGTITSDSCGGASNTLCCLPVASPPEMNPCVQAGGLCLASCVPGWAAQTLYSCGSNNRTCCMELGGGRAHG